MDILHAVVLAVLQGLTEFLPISSSAHLILLPALVDWPDQGLAFDVAVHVGTLGAVVIYFANELRRMTRDAWSSLVARRVVGEGRIAWYIVVATVPVGLAGLGVKAIGGDGLRSVAVIAAANLVFAVLLFVADRSGRSSRELGSLRLRDAVLIGLAQALALVPGTSRSGVTMTAGLLLGLSREAAARFSFLMAIPVIVLAGLLEAMGAVSAGATVDWLAVSVGTVVSGLCAFACIHLFLGFVERVGMLPFVLYRIALGVLLLVLVG